jgi:hypothetical protein
VHCWALLRFLPPATFSRAGRLTGSGGEGPVIMKRKTCLFPAVLSLLFLVSIGAAFGQNISTVAGGGPNSLPATSSSIGLPWGVVQFKDSGGDIHTYISDFFSNRVFHVDGSTNTLTVLAGNIVPGYFFDGGPATFSSLNGPQGIAVDSNGNVYIADTSNNVIRIVNTGATSFTIGGLSIPPGAIATVAGNSNGQSCTSASAPPCGDGGSAVSAFLTAPSGVFLDSTNNIYIADTGDQVVRVVNTQSTGITIAGVTIPAGDIATIAGNYTGCTISGSAPFCGDTGAATSAQLDLPGGVGLDTTGNIYIADTSDFAIRLVNSTTGIISTVAGSFTQCSLPPCGDGSAATSAQLNFPRAVFVDASADIFIADTQGQVIRSVVSGTINTVAGTYTQGFFGDGSAAVNAELDAPSGVFVDSAGDVFIADEQNSALREVGTNLKINTIVGIGLDAEFSGDSSKATLAALNEPAGVAADASSNWYIADTFNNRVRVVNNQSKTITVAGVSIPAGAIATIAGNGALCSTNPCGDGASPLLAQLSGPTDVALDAAGNIYIVDTEDSVIRVVNTQAAAITIAGTAIQPGTIKTVAGNINAPFGYADGPATQGLLTFPVGLTLDHAGNIYIADGNPLGGPTNNVIRVVNAQSSSITVAGVSIKSGYIGTVAGMHGTSCAAPTDSCGDGGPALSAQFNGPTGVAVDRTGNIFVADFSDYRVRKISTTGTISRFAGTGGPCVSASCGDGGPATAALLFTPFDVATDYLGNVYIADSGDYVIRAVNAGTSSVTLGGVTIGAGDISTVVGSGRFGFVDGPTLSSELAEPIGLGSDAAGDLLITDFLTWRVREVPALLATAPTATPAPGSMTFPTQALNTVSAGQDVTLTNSGNVSPLSIPKIAASGDFEETNTCTAPIPAGGDCKITVTFTPTASGTLKGTLAITDSVGTQNVSLSGTGSESAPDFTFSSTAASPASVSAGASATSTITLTPEDGFTGATTLTCTVSPAPSLAPGCSLNPASLTPAGGAASKSTLTITTTAASAALKAPGSGRTNFYAVWMLLPAMLLSTAGLAAPKRKQFIAFCLLALAVAGLLFMAACGGGSSSTGGGGSSAGTPAGTYTITVTAKSGSLTHQTQVTLTVQ